MKSKLSIVLLFTIAFSNYTCKEQDIQPEKLNIRHRKLSSLTGQETQAQKYLKLLSSDPGVIYQWGHEKFEQPNLTAISPFFETPEYILTHDLLIVKKDDSRRIDFRLSDNHLYFEDWIAFRFRSAEYAEAADYFRVMSEIPKQEVEFEISDNTAIGYEPESDDGIYEGTSRASWHCYPRIKGSESIAFKML